MPFFKLLKIHWTDCQFTRMLITENKEYECEFSDIKTVKTGSEKSWTERLRYALDKVKTEYILFFLEDFFIVDTVDTAVFDTAIKLMNQDKKIGVIKFPPGSKKVSYANRENKEKGFRKVKITEPYRTKVGVSLWRKEYFSKLLYGEESPWEYEREGSIRSIFAGYKVYEQDYEVHSPAFLYYINPKDGMGITQRKWLKCNKEYFESKGIYGINFERLGILETNITYKSIKEEYTNNRKRQHGEYIKSLNGIKKYKEILYDFKHDYIVKRLKLDRIKKYYFYWKYYQKLKAYVKDTDKKE